MRRNAAGRANLTSRQLAALIGVSQSAVSRAFTPGSSISPTLRDRILQGAREFGYQPNAIASMLTTRRSNIVGIVVSDMSNPFYPALIGRLTQKLQGVGLQSLLFNLTPGSDVETQLLAIRSYNVDAVVVVSATILSESLLSWATEGRRAVLLNRLSTDGLATVCVDNVAGARTVADHFHALGRRRIGYVGGLSQTLVGMKRQNAFIDRLAELNLQFVGAASRNAYTFEAGATSAADLMERRPDAIFFASDILALGGISALRAAGHNIPGDVAVAGFDDIEMASWPDYALTSYRQPLEDLVTAVVNRLSYADTDMDVPSHEDLPGRLIVRASTVPNL